MYYREACDYEDWMETDCGYVYWTMEKGEFWVTCDEFLSWDYCRVDDFADCDKEYLYEECSESEYRVACDGEEESICGWFYLD